MNATEPTRLLIVMPNWVGDVVMATPTLRAIRQRWPDVFVIAAIKPYAAPLLGGCPWVDQTVEPDASIKQLNCETAMILPNSFRSAWTVWRAGIRRRIGYARDGRSLLLTDRLRPIKLGRTFIPIPAVWYYLELTEKLGIDQAARKQIDRSIELFTRDEDDRWAEALLTKLNADGPVVMLNPGAATKGAAKLWPTDRYAAVADHVSQKHGATVLLGGAPSERGMLEQVAEATRAGCVNLLDHDSDLHRAKAIAARCDLVIANDSGSRHIAVAMGAPTISLFGPTDPRWTSLDAPHETVIRSTDDAHAMTGIAVSTVIEAADAALGKRGASA